MPTLTDLYEIFYVNSVKVIPENIYNLPTPVALAKLNPAAGGKRRYNAMQQNYANYFNQVAAQPFVNLINKTLLNLNNGIYKLVPQMYIFIYILSFLFISPLQALGPRPNVSRLKGIYRIGPHNIDVISVIFGSLLGDAHGEKRASGTRICFFQEAKNISYLLYLHNFFSTKGYCNPEIPEITTRLGFKGKIRQYIRFST